LAWNRIFDGGSTAPGEEWNAEIQRRRVHEGILFPDIQDNPVLSLTPPSSMAGPGVVALGNDDSTGTRTADAAINDSSQNDSTAESSPAWTPETVESIGPVVNCTRQFGEEEAAQWQA
jgi:hypothetical protein